MQRRVSGRRDSRMFLDGEGEVLGYAVETEAAAPGAHDGAPACRERSDILTELTGRLAAFHGSSESNKQSSTFGSREAVGGNWQEDFNQTDQGGIEN